jgi:hypothetical protein
MYGIVAEHKKIVRTLPFPIFIKERRKQGPVVSAKSQESNLALLAKALEGIYVRRTWSLIPHAEQQNVEVLKTRSPQSDLHRRTNQRWYPRIRLNCEDDTVTVSTC